MNCSGTKIPQINGKNVQCHQLDSTNIHSLDNCKKYVAEYSKDNTTNSPKNWYMCRKSKDKCGKKGLGLNTPFDGWFKQSKKCIKSTIPTATASIQPSNESPTGPRSGPTISRQYRQLPGVSAIPTTPKTRSRPKTRSKTRTRKQSPAKFQPILSQIQENAETSQGGKKIRRRHSLKKRKSKKSKKSRRH